MRTKPAHPVKAGVKQPNIIYIMMDDMGFGDTACYGPSRMKTPAMKRIADEGVTFTRMYTAPTCSPARAQVLTGMYAQRTGIYRVLHPDDEFGLTDRFPTIATHLRRLGYRTHCIGKWHLGVRQEHLPTRNGFDTFYGLLYSNDMQPLHLFRDEAIEEQTVDQATLTRKYTAEVLRAIDSSAQEGHPFFCYLAHTMPHVPLFVEEPFAGKSACGLYGDTLECIDYYLGKIIERLESRGLSEDTLIMVTSDNGPWYEGSVGGRRGRKFDVYEGGVRVPFLARWPTGIPRGITCDEPAHLMDMLPTLVSMAGGEAPSGIDGLDISNLFRGEGVSPHECLYLFHHNHLKAVIRGKWKVHLHCQRGEYMNPGQYPKLHDLETDPDESYCLKTKYPELTEELVQCAEAFHREMQPYLVEVPRGPAGSG